MEKTIVETSIAKFVYSRGDMQHSLMPGHFSVFDKIREETYWKMDCYDGGEGWSNKKESDVQKIGIEKFLLLNEKCKKLQTEEDKQILIEVTTPIKIEIKNPKFYGSY